MTGKLKGYGHMSEKKVLSIKGTIKNVTNNELAINNHAGLLTKYDK